jgi:hypothetical protein
MENREGFLRDEPRKFNSISRNLAELPFENTNCYMPGSSSPFME